MKLEDAPPAGWYPDPEQRARLRWWEGTDWTDIRRSVPTQTEAAIAQETAASQPPVGSARELVLQNDTERIVEQVRAAAREEFTAAADQFASRARGAIEEGRSIATQFLMVVLRWLRIAVVIAALMVIAWFIFQAIAQATFFEWLGDRIDNASD